MPRPECGSLAIRRQTFEVVRMALKIVSSSRNADEGRPVYLKIQKKVLEDLEKGAASGTRRCLRLRSPR